MKAERWRAASYARGGNSRNHDAMLTGMRSSHSIRAAIARAGAGLRRCPSASAQQKGGRRPPPLPDASATNFTIFVRGVPDRDRADCADARRRRLDDRQLGTPRRAARRGRTAPAGAVHGRMEAARVHARRHRSRTATDGAHGRRRHDRQERRDDHRAAGAKATPSTRPRCSCCPTASSAHRGAGRSAEDRRPRQRHPMYAVAACPFNVRVGESAPEQIQTAGRTIAARRTHVTLRLPGAPLDADIWTDESGRMIRFSVPSQFLDVAREDIAAVSSRSVTISRPNDESLTIPSNGFTLASTLSKPTAAGAKTAGRRAGRRQRSDRSRRTGVRHSDLRPDRRRARRRRLHRRPLRQARHRPERRPRRSRPRSPTTPTICARRSSCCPIARTSTRSASPSSATAKAASWR